MAPGLRKRLRSAEGTERRVLLAAGCPGLGLGLLTADPGESPSVLLSSPNASDSESVKPEEEA